MTNSLPDQFTDLSSSPSRRLDGRMGTVRLALTVLAMSAPIGNVVGVLPLGITGGNGVGSPVIYLVLGVVFLVFAVGFTTMTRNLPRAGAFYTYITAGLTRPVGLGAGLLAAFGYLILLVGNYAFFGVSVQHLFTEFGSADTPWWLWALLCGVVVTLLGHFNVEISGRALAVLMVVEVVLVMLFNVPVLVTGGPHGYQFQSFVPSEVFSGNVGVAVLFAIACFMGFESSAIYREEVQDPDRTIPRATYIAIVAIGSFYVVTSWALVTFWGTADVSSVGQDDPSKLFTDGFRFYLGSTFTDVMTCLVASSVFAAALACHNALARYSFSLGRDGIFPAILGKPHPTHGSPSNASVFATVGAFIVAVPFILAGLGPVTLYSWMFAVGTFILIVLMLLTSLAVIRYFKLVDHHERAWNTVVAPTLGFLGLGALAVLSSLYFPMSIGGSLQLALLFQGIVAGILLFGIGIGIRWRSSRPKVYQRIGGLGEPLSASAVPEADSR
ncbi:APC family permease [Mycolicibacterium sp. P1-18]|uniref:APC family permease n=1 Tax=Mycolicibacterium sp. P1-18 TaxID=2024615 RepID=UPI0011F122BA|nr:APC family permease [Mycolicibacterium sp. P1-18]KAA0098599.1 APC family permease [Mycolicibacterium sp. P1-18]